MLGDATDGLALVGGIGFGWRAFFSSAESGGLDSSTDAENGRR